MLRIMIVDDEPNIVEGLYYLIQSMDTEGLDVSKAYSGREALALIGEAPVDLVLSDIRMPGMSGLQLLSAIEEYWPSCRIVFLTGYGEFDYIHTAIKSPQCVGYLLKTEGDEIIIDTMRREIGKINELKEHSTLLARAREQMTAMLSLLREQYLRLLVTEGSQANGPAGFDGSELKLRIDPGKPMLAAVGWLQPSSQMGYLERTRLVLAIDEAIADAFGSHATREFAMLDEGMVVWLLQNGSWAQGCDPAAGPVESFAGYVGAGLQLVQNNVRQIGAAVSFALASGAVGVEELPLKVHSLQALAIGMGAAGSEMIIHEQQAEAMLPPGGEEQALQHQRFPLQLRRLEPLLVDGCSVEFTQEFQRLFSLPEGGFVKIDDFCQTAMLTMLLSVAGRLNLSGEIVSLIRLQELLPAGGEDGSVPMELNLKFGQELCRLRLAHMKSTAEESVDRVKQYVLQNIADKNLSLSRIAAFTFYNPSYLSRFFKQETGSNLSDYINEVRLNRALELLRNRDVRINEITNRIGFESPSYFTMFFKKRMGVTPNEYRSSFGS